jgi:hypothetical protein
LSIQIPTDQVGIEDELSIRRHVTDLQSEMRKREPSREVMLDKLKRTVNYRRIFCEQHKTSEVLDEFPVLANRVLVR